MLFAHQQSRFIIPMPDRPGSQIRDREYVMPRKQVNAVDSRIAHTQRRGRLQHKIDVPHLSHPPSSYCPIFGTAIMIILEAKLPRVQRRVSHGKLPPKWLVPKSSNVPCSTCCKPSICTEDPRPWRPMQVWMLQWTDIFFFVSLISD